MNRPVVDEAMVRAAAEQIAQRLNADANSIVEEYSHPMDGFDLVKRLDKYQYWDCSRDDMHVLDDMQHLVDKKLREAEEAWFKDNNIQPPYPVGTHIKEGVIAGASDYRPAYYQVKLYGCTTEGRYRLIPFEEAEKVVDIT